MEKSSIASYGSDRTGSYKDWIQGVAVGWLGEQMGVTVVQAHELWKKANEEFPDDRVRRVIKYMQLGLVVPGKNEPLPCGSEIGQSGRIVLETRCLTCELLDCICHPLR